MTQPIALDIPHKLGLAGVRDRLDGGVGKLAGMFPGGGHVDKRWEGDTLHFTVSAMGQRVVCRLDCFAERVHAVVDLPPMLALFADRIRTALRDTGTKLLN